MSDQMKLNIKIDELDDYLCPKCKGKQWAPVFAIKIIGAIQSPVGKAGSLHHQLGFMCTGCGFADSLGNIANECKKIAEKGPGIEVPFTLVKSGAENDS